MNAARGGFRDGLLRALPWSIGSATTLLTVFRIFFLRLTIHLLTRSYTGIRHTQGFSVTKPDLFILPT